MKTTKIAINGFGRIGRLFLRQIIDEANIEVVAINDLGDVENSAYLFKYDTVYRSFPGEVSQKRKEEGGKGKDILKIDGKEILFLQEKDATKLPWKELGIDIVIESTGVFESFEKAKVHLDAGAKRVVLTAPAKDADNDFGKTVLLGINESDMKVCKISANASCTTNSVSPLIAIMSESVGIEKAVLNTVHALTNTQAVADAPVRGADFRRGRASGQNIVPSTTGAAIAVTRAFKELDGNFDGIAIRVPVIAGSIADVTFISKRKTTVEEVNDVFRKAAQSTKWNGILKVIDDQIVSSDIIGEPYGAIIDLKLTKVIGGNLVKVLSWYDNEWGYTTTLVKHVLLAANSL